MKKVSEFFKTTIVGGLFVMLPVLLLYLLFGEILDLVVVLATPIADLLPKGALDDSELPVITALILIIGVSFILGIVMRSEIGRRLGRWLENLLFGRLALYNVLKRLTTSFTSIDKDRAFRPALVNAGNGSHELAYMVEDHGDGNATILLPRAPAALTGPVKVVPRTQIELLNISLGDFSMVLSHWGIGLQEMIDKGRTDNG